MTHRVLNSYKSKANVTIKWEGIFSVSLSIYDVYINVIYIYILYIYIRTLMLYIYIYIRLCNIYIYIYIYICMYEYIILNIKLGTFFSISFNCYRFQGKF